MPFVYTAGLKVTEHIPGWKRRFFHTSGLTIAHYDFVAGAAMAPHHHPAEEVYEVLEGEIEVTIDGISQVAAPGIAAVIPPNAPHSVHALTAGRMIVISHPSRPDLA
jgi:quercetin dioxygenase-like cupin family protein